MTNLHDPFTAITELLRADTEAALASIAQTQAFAARLGIELASTATDNLGKRGPVVSATKGKSKPNLAGWLRRATPDGTLPSPTETLIVSKRMVQQGLTAGYITGNSHPYRVTPAGLHDAVINFKGRKIARGW